MLGFRNMQEKLEKHVFKKSYSQENMVLKNLIFEKAICEQFEIDFQSCCNSIQLQNKKGQTSEIFFSISATCSFTTKP